MTLFVKLKFEDPIIIKKQELPTISGQLGAYKNFNLKIFLSKYFAHLREYVKKNGLFILSQIKLLFILIVTSFGAKI